MTASANVRKTFAGTAAKWFSERGKIGVAPRQSALFVCWLSFSPLGSADRIANWAFEALNEAFNHARPRGEHKTRSDRCVVAPTEKNNIVRLLFFWRINSVDLVPGLVWLGFPASKETLTTIKLASGTQCFPIWTDHFIQIQIRSDSPFLVLNPKDLVRRPSS